MSAPFSYNKIIVKDPFTNRNIIAKVAKKQKGVYIWESLDGESRRDSASSHMYVGHSINLYNRISSKALFIRPTKVVNLGLHIPRYYSCLTRINPWSLTGFLDAESSFYLELQPT